MDNLLGEAAVDLLLARVEPSHHGVILLARVRRQLHTLDRGLDQLLGLAFGRLGTWELSCLDE